MTDAEISFEYQEWPAPHLYATSRSPKTATKR